MNLREGTPDYWPARIAPSCLSLDIGYWIWKHLWVGRIIREYAGMLAPTILAEGGRRVSCAVPRPP